MASEFRISDGIVFVTFSGILSSDSLRDAFQRMAEIEAESDPVPNRLVDISATEGVNLNFNSMMGLADMRMKAPLKNATKTAVVTGNLVQHGFARMFHTLNKNPNITIQIFSSESEGLAWLRAEP
jgi:hypothetical protein